MEEETGQPDFASLLLRNLRPDGPWVPPKSWESIESEGGGAATAGPEPLEQPCDLLAVSDAMLVRLALNALQGVKSALHDIEKISVAFCSSSADRTFHQIPSLWHRSSSMNTLGRLLKSIGRSGLIFFILRKFVDYFLGMDRRIEVQYPNKGAGERNQFGNESAKGVAKQEMEEIQIDELGAHSPYTLVNQAFAVAVGKVLEGYLCSLNTVFDSVKFRRSWNTIDKSKHIFVNVGSLTNALSKITLLEVYLHTKELRTHIEVLGNICGLRIDDPSFSGFSGEGFAAKTNLEFNSFPRGADLLTYLYVQLRDADPIHWSLLKFLFVRSCEPYCHFVRLWIYKARTNDPYKEFIVEYLDKLSHLYGTSSNFTKERDYTSVPCFLQHVSAPLLRAGQQLKVLIKLLGLCDSSVFEGRSCGQINVSCDLTSVEDVLPYWSDSLSNSDPCLSLLTFSKKDAEAMIKKRESIYRMMNAKLQFFFKGLVVRYQPIKQMVMPFGYTSFYSDERYHVDSQISSVTDESLGFSPSSIDGVAYVSVDFEETGTFSTADGSSYGVDLKQTSDDSAFTHSEENSEPESTDRPDSSIEQDHFSASLLSSSNGMESIYQSSSETENSWVSVFASLRRPALTPNKCARADSIKSVNSQKTGVRLNRFSDPLQSDNTVCATTTRALHEDSLSVMPWPLGGLSENPFYGDEKYQSHKQFLSLVPNENMETENSNAVKMYTLDNFKLEQTTKESDPCHSHVISVKNFVSSWNLQCKYDLSANPILIKAAWLHNFRCYKRSFLPYFDFSLVEDPYEAFSERSTSQCGCRLQDQHNVPVNSTSLGVNKHVTDNVSVSQADESGFFSANSPAKQSHMSLWLGNHSAEVSGGASWERLLRYADNDAQTISGGVGHCLAATSSLPLDVAIDKCIVQGILHQYIYISKFTIRLLEEGFDLHQHLLALRRYHFMEFADWADSFVVSLLNHKWSAIETSNLAVEIQSLLVVALQRSSCESDPYHERLYIYPKGQGMVPLSFSAIGTFDFIGLGYKVDWPISIIVTQDALNVYSEIFNFLLQVRLAVFSLSSLWHSLKALVHSIGSRLYLGGQRLKDFNFFLKIRQQVNHFVSTLQQYLQSQLSDVSWCRFLHSLKHQVNDMLDLELVHMSYLADAQNICFLSIETQAVAKIIKAILQCALDFRSCFKESTPKVVLDGPDLSFLFGQINFSKACSIKVNFEKNVKDLYLCYLKSPKHSESSLCRFWSYLDYNDYYSSVIQGMSY